MRKILTMTLMAIGLMSGLAAADDRRDDSRRDEHRERDRDHDRDRDRDRHVDERRRERYDTRYDTRYDRDRVIHYRSYRERPALRFERHVDRAGYQWIEGRWLWNSYEWIWMPGHYERVYYR